MTAIILKGLSIPARGAAIVRTSKYPIEDLVEGGDPMFIPNAKKSVPVAVGKRAKTLGIKVVTRKIKAQVEFDENGAPTGPEVEGIAVWRVKADAADAAAE